MSNKKDGVNSKPINLDLNEVSALIKKTKDSICDVVEKGAFTVWVKAEASGKVLGIGASGESGIQVEVDCSGSKLSAASDDNKSN